MHCAQQNDLIQRVFLTIGKVKLLPQRKNVQIAENQLRIFKLKCIDFCTWFFSGSELWIINFDAIYKFSDRETFNIESRKVL